MCTLHVCICACPKFLTSSSIAHTGSGEGHDPKVTGEGVTSKGECLVLLNPKCTSCVSIGSRTRRAASTKRGVTGVGCVHV